MIRKAVIPAAGLGTRLSPVSRHLTKELLPIGDQPMLHYSVREAIDAGVREIYIIINRKRKHAIQSFYEETGCLSGANVELIFLEQAQPVGIVDAILQSKKYIYPEPFLLLMPDNVFFGERGAADQIAAMFEEYNQNILGLIKVTSENAMLFGNSGRVRTAEIDKSIFIITEIEDKTRAEFNMAKEDEVLRACGRYALQKEFFDLAMKLQQNMQGQDEIPILRELGIREQLMGKLLQGALFDCGRWPGYWAGNRFWSQQSKSWN